MNRLTPDYDLPTASPPSWGENLAGLTVVMLLGSLLVAWAVLGVVMKSEPAGPPPPAAATPPAPVRVAPAVQPLPQPASVVPEPRPVSWHRVKLFEGSSMKTTEDFDIQGDQWRIIWRSWTGGEDSGYFGVIVRTADGQMKELVGNTIGGNGDTSYLRGSGRYYLEISSSQPYTILVEDFR